ncbi:flagellar biosynthesis protein FlhA [Treponema brennaborense]|uniref:Flagellar biosynthesis protein FlhA n=1 Tax=Treponema brennaborense (strain DSM 12168 / CIP 105900 / DD5/3) TaxID=906968 RepID=F4LKX2_TREBD|nr:flagellar biosynthesis protein FlhA [Treponema brennaborense]AEE16569.1 flagellar biosynthesis protein FlhA [Treponema brennaborense DSM 12168]
MADKAGFFKNSQDLFIAVSAVVVVMMLIVPLPTLLLDVLMAFNLLLSVLMLLIVLYTPKATDFSSFPTMLLVSTVFGLGLNVSSTRLILSKGAQFDGRMVKAFASFVVGSGGTEGLLIGFVIFIILIAVQTFVITKGATRVAEVAARFTLDAMPMKQAAVEAEYNAGAITEEEARKRKLDVQREADFYGAMDGSTKFVSGNVKVGIFITVINLVVGLIFGMLRGENFSQAIQTYASFTIGDGLLSQLPSLLVSFATGIIVTRSASDQTLGSDVKKQFSQNAWVYFVAGGTMSVIGILPGFPWYVLVPLGGALIYLGFRLRKIQEKSFAQKVAAEKEKQKTQTGGAPADASSVAPLDPLSLELGYALIPLVDKEKGAELLERVTLIRREMALDLGVIVPRIRITDNVRLEPSEYCFKIKGVAAGSARIKMGWYLCINSGGVTEDVPGEKTTEPAFGLPAVWVTEDNRERAERAGYAIVDPPTMIATHLTEIIKRRAAEILGRQEVQSLIESLKKDYPAVVDEVMQNFKIGEIVKVLQGLLKEQVSVRNLVVILETLADYGGVTKKTDVLIERVRQALGRQICLQYADESGTLHVMTVDQGFLQKVLDSRVDTVNGPVAMLDPVSQRDWISALSSAIASIRNLGYAPVLLCPESARVLVKSSIDREMPGVVVLSSAEITNDVKLESLGEVKVG